MFTPVQAIAQDLAGRSTILDGEIVHPGPDGRPMFYELIRRRGPFCFYAFDLLWLDGRDLRDMPCSSESRTPEAASAAPEVGSVCGSRGQRHGIGDRSELTASFI